MKEFIEKAKKKLPLSHLTTIGQLVVEVLVLYVIFMIILCSARVSGESMNPTYHDGTFLLAFRYDTPEKGDIVLAKDESYDTIVKRVIAEGGDEISIAAGQVYVNGDPIPEPYVVHRNETEYLDSYVVPEGEYFLAGDNRANSLDSRNQLGTFTEDDIIGVVFFNIF